MLKIVLVGEESAGVQALRTIQESGHELVSVMTSSPEASRRAPLWQAATDTGVSTGAAQLVRSSAFAQELRAADVDLLINVHSLYVIEASVLDAPRIGSFNLHPGPLPRYAGLNSVSWAIYRGEDHHGVTLHWMESGIDTGDIAYLETFLVGKTDTPVHLNARCVELGMEMIGSLLRTASAGLAVPRKPQDRGQREYFGKEVPQNGCVHWDAPAEEIERFVRACDYGPFGSPWGQPRARYGAHTVELVAVERSGGPCDVAPGTVGEVGEAGTLVACGDEWIRVRRMRLDGKRARAHEIFEQGRRLENGV